MSVELHYEALGGIARRLQACELSAVEPTRTILDRIERRDGRLKSFATVVPEHALKDASLRDAGGAAGVTRGSLHGLTGLEPTSGLASCAGVFPACRVARSCRPDVP